MPRLATIIICLFLSVILGFFLVWPQYKKYSDARWEVKKKEIERNNQEEYYIHLEDVNKKLSGYSEELLKINSALPYSPDVPELLSFLERAAFRNGLNIGKITSFSTEKPQSGLRSGQQKEAPISRLREINIEFEISGNYPDFKNFIFTLEKSARLIEIESIILKKAKNVREETEAPPPIFSFKIKTYY